MFDCSRHYNHVSINFMNIYFNSDIKHCINLKRYVKRKYSILSYVIIFYCYSIFYSILYFILFYCYSIFYSYSIFYFILFSIRFYFLIYSILLLFYCYSIVILLLFYCYSILFYSILFKVNDPNNSATDAPFIFRNI